MEQLFSRHEDDEEELRRRGLGPAPPPAPPPAQAPARATSPPPSSRPNYPANDPRHAPSGFRSPYEGAEPGRVAMDAAKKVMGGVSENFRGTNEAVTRAKGVGREVLDDFAHAEGAVDMVRAVRNAGLNLVGGVADVGLNYARDATRPLMDPLMDAGRARADYAKGFYGLDGPPAGKTAEASVPTRDDGFGPPQDSPGIDVTVTRGQTMGPPPPEPGSEDVAVRGSEAVKPVSAPPQDDEAIEIIRGTQRSWVNQSGHEVDAPKGATATEDLMRMGFSQQASFDKSLELMQARADVMRGEAAYKNSVPLILGKRINAQGVEEETLLTLDAENRPQMINTGNVLRIGESLVVPQGSETSATGERIEHADQALFYRPQRLSNGKWGYVSIPFEDTTADERMAVERASELQALVKQYELRKPGLSQEDYYEAAMQRLRENPREEE